MEKGKYNSEDLLSKYKAGTCSAEEKAIVESWHISTLKESNFFPDEAELNRAKENIWAALPIHQDHPKRVVLWPKFAVAASLLLILSFSFYLLLVKEEKPVARQTQAERFKNDVLPGSTKALLVLSDGHEVVLDDRNSGFVANQGDATINKVADGQLVYNKTNQDAEKPLTNKLVIPKGGQYRLTLPDGTKVWMNSFSTLIYPTFFKGNTREVELIGEAYFEVAKNKDAPFRVHARNQVVEVLGTHFNLNSYATELNTKTTLLEGSVKVISGTTDHLLKPGFQAEVGTQVRIQKADPDQVLAWMNGDFNFKDEDIQSIMRKLERWYDIEVIYEGKINGIDYGAEISRSRTLSQVLGILEKTGNVHFKIEGRRVTVMQ